jgi:cyclopropane fatty-acyl-phospholipid synthase-like methyltransferase
MDCFNYEQRYRDKETPWDHGSADFNLDKTVHQFSIRPCKALDLGCGMGNNSIWLAQQGFNVVGFDFSATAIERAQSKIGKAGVDCSLQVGDFFVDDVEGGPFSFVFDRGCFHSVTEPADRLRFSKKVASVLQTGGLWLSLIGNADEPKREVGPPRMTATEITTTVESDFEILALNSGVFGDDQNNPPRAWICLMQKR